MPTSTSFWNRRAAPPSLVKIAVPFPYGFELISSSALSYDGARTAAGVQVGGHLVPVFEGDQRTHVGSFIVTGAHPEPSHPLRDPFEQLVADRIHGHHDGDRHASLTGRAEPRGDRGVRGQVQI